MKDTMLEEYLNNLPQRKGGFRKIDDGKTIIPCSSREHLPPSHIHLPGGTYEYTCPDCGHVTIVNVPIISY